MAPPIPPRKLQYPEVIEYSSSPPFAKAASISVNSGRICLRNHHLICNNGSAVLDIYTGQLVSKSNIPAYANSMENGSSSLKFEDGILQIANVMHEFSKRHSITAAVLADNNYWVAWSNNSITVYSAVEKNQQLLKLIASFTINSNVRQFSFCSESNQLATLLESTQVLLFDSLLLDIQVAAEMKKRERDYSVLKRYKINVASWNVGGCLPPASRTFWVEWLGLESSPEIIVVGLQEIVDLDQIRSNMEALHKWQVAIQHVCTEEYMLIDSVSMVGLGLMIWGKRSLDAIKHSSVASIKNGLKGMHGNKGAVGWRAVLEDTSVCVVNCHLAAGQNAQSDRNADASLILKTLRFPAICNEHIHGSMENIMEHNHVFLFGDMNYRIDRDRNDVKDLVSRREFAELLKYDQLISQRGNINFVLNSLYEPPITFAPTYKYDPGTNSFDSSDKQRIPSYCDRILYKQSDSLQLISYNMYQDITLSDHRPVYARFNAEICRHENRKLVAAFKHHIYASILDKFNNH